MTESVKDIDGIIAEIEDGLLGIGQRAYDLWAGQGRDLKAEAAVRVQRGDATVAEIVAEETADMHVYEILYFGAPYRLYGERGPDQYDLHDVEALAEDTLNPGQELTASENGRVVAHFKADPTGTVWGRALVTRRGGGAHPPHRQQDSSGRRVGHRPRKQKGKRR